MGLSNLYENIRTLIRQFVYTKEETNALLENKVNINDNRLKENVFYGTCSTIGSTQTKVVTVDDWSFDVGNILFVKFDAANSYDGTAKISIDGTAKNIVSIGTTTTSRYYWQAGELITFIYDGTNMLLLEGGIATTTYYGSTKLSSSVSSTSEELSATPKAVKTAYDLANGKADSVHTHTVSDVTDLTIPTNTSDLVNDGSDGSDTYVENEELTTALNGKQDDLSELSSVSDSYGYNIFTNNGSFFGILNEQIYHDYTGTDELHFFKSDNTDVSFDDLATLDDIPTQYTHPSTHSSSMITDTNTHTNIGNTTNTLENILTNIDSKLGSLANVDLIEVTSSLDTPSSNTMNKLFLVAESSNATNDNYEIFITVKTGTSGNYSYAWEKIDTARIDLSNYLTTTNAQQTYVAKETGKGLSSNDYTTSEKNKLANLHTVATSGSYNDLTNKPTIPTGSSTNTDIKMDGTQSAGSSSNFAKADHVHPTDTSRVAVAQGSGNSGKFMKVNSSGNVVCETVDIPDDVSDLTDSSGVIPTDVSDLSDSTGIIPTDTSDLSNGAGFLTSHQDISTKLNVSDVKDNLTSTDIDKPLSANQGKELKSLVDGKADSSHTHGQITKDGKVTTTVTVAGNDSIVITDFSDSSKIKRVNNLLAGHIVDSNAHTNIGSVANAMQSSINSKIDTAISNINSSLANKLEESDLLDLIYPVGSIYMSVNSTSPSVLFGGSWIRLKDTFLLASGDTYDVDPTTRMVDGQEVNVDTALHGEANHTLTINEMPSHTHKQNQWSIIVSSGGNTGTNGLPSGTLVNSIKDDRQPNNRVTEGAGSGNAHNNMPPYLVVNVWKRTA